MEAYREKIESNPVINRIREEPPTERRINYLLAKLERKLEEDSASSFSADDFAFQLTDLKLQIEEITKKRSQSENIYLWLLLFVSLMTLGAVMYLSSYVISNI